LPLIRHEIVELLTGVACFDDSTITLTESTLLRKRPNDNLFQCELGMFLTYTTVFGDGARESDWLQLYRPRQRWLQARTEGKGSRMETY
jgi:hypothetical protein